MTLKTKIMVTVNYMIGFAYLFLGSLGVGAFIGMMSCMSVDELIHNMFSNLMYWAVLIAASAALGTKENAREGYFKD